jgi:methionine synthase I (cobalamin-dependent)
MQETDSLGVIGGCCGTDPECVATIAMGSGGNVAR